MSISGGKLLYHLTKLDNMENIFKYGLLSRNELITIGLSFEDVADPQIISFRKENGINDYVPFHFYPGNPFDGRVKKDNPECKFVYICIHRNVAKQNGFKIIPCHPIHMENFKMFEYDEGMKKIEWEIIDNYENRPYTDREVRNICMAECLTDKKIDFNMIQSIAVKDKNDKDTIEELKKKYDIKEKFFIDVKPNWFKNT